MTTFQAIKNEYKVSIPSEYFIKKPLSNENISYTLKSLISQDGGSLDCRKYVSDVLISTQEFGGIAMMPISRKSVIF